MRRSIAALGFLFLLFALFLPWLPNQSANLLVILPAQLTTMFAGASSIVTLSLLLFVAGLIGGLLGVGRRISPFWPGVVSAASAVLWLYGLESGGSVALLGAVTGLYLALLGGVLFAISSAGRTNWAQESRRPPMYELKNAQWEEWTDQDSKPTGL